MTRPRKTSITPKKKPKPLPTPPKPVYPDYIEEFIKDVERDPTFKVRVDQYITEGGFRVSVLKYLKKAWRCIWTMGDINNTMDLNQYKVSQAYTENPSKPPCV